jgi:hypothetical protein
MGFKTRYEFSMRQIHGGCPSHGRTFSFTERGLGFGAKTTQEQGAISYLGVTIEGKMGSIHAHLGLKKEIDFAESMARKPAVWIPKETMVHDEEVDVTCRSAPDNPLAGIDRDSHPSDLMGAFYLEAIPGPGVIKVGLEAEEIIEKSDKLIVVDHDGVDSVWEECGKHCGFCVEKIISARASCV